MALVNNVLDSARVESGLVTVECVPGSPESALRAATTNLEPEASRKGIALSSLCATSDSFMGDQQRVEQVLLNLVSNAVKFTPQGGTVRISCQSDGEGPVGFDSGDRWIRFDVEDTGVGVSPDQLAHIFEPFVQAQDRQAREKGGTGLGLTISRRLARLMGGDITVQSVVGEGSTFTLWLRAAVTTESAMV
jgi:signal transduction histidine kinase